MNTIEQQICGSARGVKSKSAFLRNRHHLAAVGRRILFLLLIAAAALQAAAPVVSSPTTLTAIPGITIAYQITASNSPTSFAATGLPTNWAIDPTSGVVQGLIAQTGTVGSTIAFNVTAANASGTSAAVSVSCAVAAQSMVSQQYRIGSTASPAPVPFWVSAPVLPDDTVLVTGGRLLPSTVAHLAQLSNGDAGMPAFPTLGFVLWGAVTPGTATSRSLHVGIPAAWSTGIYALRLANGSTVGPSILVNAPDPWFAMGDCGMEVSPGGTLYVAGHCLAYSGQTTTIALVNNGAIVARLTGTSFASDQRGWGYAVSATMPSVPYGLYDVWLHNGFGGANGWAKAADPLSVIPVFSWPSSTVDFESVSGANDDAKMTAAKAAVPSSGGTILLPARTIALSASLVLPKMCRLKGQGKASTLLSFSGACSSPLITGVALGNFALEDLKVYAPASYPGIGIQYAYQPSYLPGWMKRVDVELDESVPPGGDGTNGGVCVWFRQTKDFAMEDCVFDSPFPVRGFDTVFGVRLSRCTIDWREMSIQLYGMTTHVIVDNCTLNIRGNPTTDRWVEFSNPNPGIAFGAFKAGGGSIGGQYIKNVLLSNCTHTRDDHSYAMPGYVGYTTDGANSIYTGPFNSSGTTLTLPSPTVTISGSVAAVYDWTGCRVSILAGAGAGQHRTVVAGATPGQTNLTIDKPWDVAPDSTSMIDIGCQVGNTLMIANDWSEARLIQHYYNGVNNTVAGGDIGSSDGQSTTCIPWSGLHYSGYFPNAQMQFLSINNRYGKVQYQDNPVAGIAPFYTAQAGFVVRDMRETSNGSVIALTRSGYVSGTNSAYLPVRDFLIERVPGPVTYSKLDDYGGSYAARLVDIAGTTLPSTAVRLSDTPYSLPVTVAQDYATWAAAYGLPAGSGTSDTDGDGRSNLLEYAFGASPSVADSTQPIALDTESGPYAFRFTRPKWVTGITYTLEGSDDLLTWTSVANQPSVESSTALTDTLATDVAAGKAHYFLRLRVTSP